MNRWRRRQLYRAAQQEWNTGIVAEYTNPSIGIERPGAIPAAANVAYHEARRRVKSGADVDRYLPLEVWALVLARALQP